MTKVTYDKQHTALLVIDPYNDFISEGGKVWDRLQAVAEANRCVPHMVQVLHAARQAGLRVFYALHRRYRPGDYESWKYMAPIQSVMSWLRSRPVVLKRPPIGTACSRRKPMLAMRAPRTLHPQVVP